MAQKIIKRTNIVEPLDVIEVATFSSLPVTGVSERIYITQDTNIPYRWDGVAYVSLVGTGGGVESVTGTAVDNTDPLNPVVNIPTGGLTGSGTLNKLAKFTPNGTTLGDSRITDNIAEAYVKISARLEQTSLNGNTYIGASAGFTDNLTGNGYNVGIGAYAGYRSTTGDNNVNVGASAGFNANVAIGNVNVGGSAGYSNQIGNYNVCLGNTAGFSLKSNKNIAIGYSALRNPVNGDYNIGIGSSALDYMDGAENTALGRDAGTYIANGSTPTYLGNNNLFLGSRTKALVNNGTNEIVIGYDVTGAGSNTTTIGNSSIIKTLLGGISITPNATNALITAEPTGKVLITKEFANATYATATANLQKEVTTSYAIVNADNKYTIFFNSATPITATINTLTTANFECDFYNLGAGAVTFVNGTATVGYPDGTILNTDKVCALVRFMATTTYKLKGELA